MKRNQRERKRLYALAFHLGLAAALWVGSALATPPDYKSFGRTQEISPAIREEDLLRIWVIYIGQGDAILIQLPKRFSYSADGRKERVDVLVDGGPSGQQLLVFLRALYPAGARIEHVVLTHHDTDHVQGLTALLRDDAFAVEHIYHNGLASWGRKALPPSGWPSAGDAVVDRPNGRLLGLLDGQSPAFQSRYLIKDLAALQAAISNDSLVGVYQQFATAVAVKKKPTMVGSFDRTFTGSSFIAPRVPTSTGPTLRFEALWPRERPRRYGDWGYTINGNSTTFRLEYGEFSMLFTGDHNEVSEQDLLNAFKSASEPKLRSDVLKIPHHGSQHNVKEFFEAVSPIISVDSMGRKGFGTRWRHPSPKVIKWAGGAHRVYHTYIHERAFDYATLDEAKQAAMVERTHVLVETDGRWFRVVETDDPRKVPRVTEVKRGNGTRWIDARE